MTHWPALEEFDAEEVHDSIRRVYRRLRLHHLVLYEARPTKVYAVADTMRMNRDRAGKAIDWLIAHGYIIQTKREGRIRWLILAWRREFPPNGENSTRSVA